jgi:hypothetical protein
VAAAKRKKSKKTSDWSWRLAGIALCAFFALGVITGLSRSGRSLASRVETLLRMLPLTSRSALMPNLPIPLISRGNAGAIALIKRTDGFYALDSDGSLRGPIAPTTEGDLPIVSGASILSASGEQLVSYVSLLVRSEATLGLTISEMRVDSDEIATLYLERPAVQITIDIVQAPDEIAHSMRILDLWRNHAEMLAAVDMTVPGQAIVRVRHAELLTAALDDQPRVASHYSKAHAHTSPEVTATR